MPPRQLLRSQLEKAWKKTIKNQYREQLINSERGLQVYFCNALLRSFKRAKLNRRVFVEPCISTGQELGPLYPDVVICNSQEIIGVIELKYLPRTQPKYEKDLNTLKYVASKGRRLTITNNRFLGKTYGKKTYDVASDAVLCWALQ